MVSLLVRCDVHINVEAGGTHDRVAALFLDDGLDGRFVGLEDFRDATKNRIYILLIVFRIRKAPFVEFDTNVMVSLLVRCDVHINGEAGGTHDRVAALLVDDGLNGSFVGLEDFREATKDRIYILLVVIWELGKKHRIFFLQSQCLGKFHAVFLRNVLLMVESGGQPDLVHIHLVCQFRIGESGCLLCRFQFIEVGFAQQAPHQAIQVGFGRIDIVHRFRCNQLQEVHSILGRVDMIHRFHKNQPSVFC